MNWRPPVLLSLAGLGLVILIQPPPPPPPLTDVEQGYVRVFKQTQPGMSDREYEIMARAESAEGAAVAAKRTDRREKEVAAMQAARDLDY